MRKFLGNMVVLIITLVAVIGAVEFGLRYYYVGRFFMPDMGPPLMIPHKTRAFALRPDTDAYMRQVDAVVPFRINKAGFRGPELDEPKRRFRILVLGDSAVAGSRVDNASLLTAVMQRKLGADRFEVINGGTPAYNAVQVLLTMRETMDTLKPDLVIFTIAPVNDIQGTDKDLRALFKKKFKRPVGYVDSEGRLQIDTSAVDRFYEKQKVRPTAAQSRPLYDQFSLYHLVKQVVQRFTKAKLHDPNILLGWPFLAAFAPEYSTRGLSADDYTRLWDGGVKTIKAIILEARDLAKREGVGFAVASMPGKLQIMPGLKTQYLQRYENLKFDLTRFDRELEQFANENDVPHLDALKPMIAAREAGRPNLFPKVDQHMDVGGHEVIGNAFAAQLEAMGLLEAKE